MRAAPLAAVTSVAVTSAAVSSAVVTAVAVIAVAAATTDVRAAERPAVVVTPGQEQKFGIALQKFAGGPDAEAYREGIVAALEFSSLFRLTSPASVTTEMWPVPSHLFRVTVLDRK